VDPYRDAKALCPRAKGPAAVAAMPPLAVPAVAARRVPLPPWADAVVGAMVVDAREVDRELFMDDYLVEDIGMFDAQMELPPDGECGYCYVYFFCMICVLVLMCFLATGSGSGQMVVVSAKPVGERALVKDAVATSLDPWAHLCAVADGGGEVASASTAEGVAATLARQLCYVGFFF
jgi:hypothetical protein